MVRKGEVLFGIDPRPFVAALEQAHAQQAQAEAQFARAAATSNAIRRLRLKKPSRRARSILRLNAARRDTTSFVPIVQGQLVSFRVGLSMSRRSTGPSSGAL
jgi:multidrug resistance efflux pump